MKRLLCIVGGMNVGGAETFLMKVYRNLDRTQYQMDFAVAIEGVGSYDEEIKSLGGRIHHITPKSTNVIKNFYDIKNLVKKEGYDYVLRTSQHSLSALELFAARLGGAKVRAFRSSNSNTTSGSKKQMLLHKICAFMPKCFANVKIAPSTEAANFMFGEKSVTKGRAKLLHNAIDLSVYRYNESERKEIRKELGISETATVVGHIGRLSQQKNHAFLLKVFKDIYTKNENTVLLLVGKGELEANIRNQVAALGLEDRVVFTGVRSDVPSLLSAMDVFVMPSFYEGMPNTVIEAQATGLPCVIADTITKEANITGLVDYLSLKTPTDQWATVVLSKASKLRRDTKEDFVAAEYEIDSTVRKFVQLVFGDTI